MPKPTPELITNFCTLKNCQSEQFCTDSAYSTVLSFTVNVCVICDAGEPIQWCHAGYPNRTGVGNTGGMNEAVYDLCMRIAAVSKDGKPLAGAALTSFLTKCRHDACDAKAVSSTDGKKLSGATKREKDAAAS